MLWKLLELHITYLPKLVYNRAFFDGGPCSLERDRAMLMASFMQDFELYLSVNFPIKQYNL